MIRKIVVHGIQYDYSYQAALEQFAGKWTISSAVKRARLHKTVHVRSHLPNDRDTEDRKHRKGIAVEALYYLRSGRLFVISYEQ